MAMSMPLPMNTFDFRGHEVCFVREGAGDPIVFLHNGGTSHRIWKYQIEHFANSNEVFALDMLGCGRSAKPHLEYTLDLYVDLLTEFVDELGLAPLFLVGNCMGSATAQTYAARFPDRVRGVLAFNTLTRRTITSGFNGPLVRFLAGSDAGSRHFLKLVDGRTVPRSVASLFVRSQLGQASGVDAATIDHLRDLYQDPAQLRVVFNIARNIESFAQLDRVPRRPGGPPLWSAWGGSNHVLPTRAGRRLCGVRNPDHQELLPGGGHLVMLEQPAAANAIVERFLASCDGAGQATGAAEILLDEAVTR
jgi:pimeloyl-ACP methyl ester carboxylesterase